MFSYIYPDITYRPDLEMIHLAIIESGSILIDKNLIGCRWDECEDRCDTCDHIATTGCEADSIKIYFGLELSTEEKDFLDNLVAEHLGSA